MKSPLRFEYRSKNNRFMNNATDNGPVIIHNNPWAVRRIPAVTDRPGGKKLFLAHLYVQQRQFHSNDQQ